MSHQAAYMCYDFLHIHKDCKVTYKWPTFWIEKLNWVLQNMVHAFESWSMLLNRSLCFWIIVHAFEAWSMLLNRGPCFGRPYPHTSYHAVPICSMDSACHFTRNRKSTIPNKWGCTLRNIYIHRLEFVPNHKEFELDILKKMIIIDCPDYVRFLSNIYHHISTNKSHTV